MSKPFKILFACRNFDSMAGGIERMATNIMNYLQNSGFDVHLVTWDSSTARAHYPMNPSIKWYKLDLGSPYTTASWFQRFQRQLLIRRIAHQIAPSVVIGFQFGTFFAVTIYDDF